MLNYKLNYHMLKNILHIKVDSQQNLAKTHVKCDFFTHYCQLNNTELVKTVVQTFFWFWRIFVKFEMILILVFYFILNLSYKPVVWSLKDVGV